MFKNLGVQTRLLMTVDDIKIAYAPTALPENLLSPLSSLDQPEIHIKSEITQKKKTKKSETSKEEMKLIALETLKSLYPSENWFTSSLMMKENGKIGVDVHSDFSAFIIR